MVQLTTVMPYIETPALKAALPGTWKRIMADCADMMKAREQSHPRDLQYELWVCSCLLRVGLEATFQNRNDDPDVWLYLPSAKVAIEAKRPGSFSAIGNAINSAHKQLKLKAFSRDKNVRGVIAISLDLPIFERSLFPGVGEPRFGLPTGPINELHTIFDAVHKEVNSRFCSFLAEPGCRVDGILFTGIYHGTEVQKDGRHRAIVLRQTGCTAHSTPGSPIVQQINSALLKAHDLPKAPDGGRNVFKDQAESES